MNKNTIRGFVALALVLAVAGAYFLGGVRWPRDVAAAPAQTASTTPTSATADRDTVSVGGTGRVSGTPDTVQLDMGVESRGADVSKALANASTALSKVIRVLKAKGVAEADLKTSGLNVRPNFRYDKNNETPPTIIDYVAAESVSVKLRDVDKAGAAISAAVAAGGNDARLNGVSLTLEGNADLVIKARSSAFADAKAKAQQYAELAGRELGAVVSITEQSGDSPPVPMYASAPAMAADAKSVPIERGSQEVAVNVQVVWAFK